MRTGPYWLFTLSVLATIFVTFGCAGDGQETPAEEQEEEGIEETPLSASPPTSAEVVQAFRDEGLEVGEARPVDEDPQWAQFIGPKTYEEGTRFEIPSLGEDQGGQVLAFESRQDLEVMKSYWENLNEQGGMLFSWVFDKDNIIVHISGRLPKNTAERYGDVLHDM